MATKNGNFPAWIRANAWREIFTRVFEKLEVKPNVYPDWLVNPTTNRRLKLDMLYPEIGVAVRLEGLQGKHQRQRPSLREEAQQRARDDARVKMCQANGIELILVDVASDVPKDTFKEIDLRLSRAREQLTDYELAQKVSQARSTAITISRRIDIDGDLKIYAELWEDRQYQLAEPSDTPPSTRQSPTFTAGMEVEHTIFGPGVVLTITPSGDDMLVTVDFINVGQKTLAASLVGDKLLPR